MKRIFALVVVVTLLFSCEDVEGNLVGVKGRDTFYPDILGPGKVPYGMIYVPSGAYQTGEDDEDIMGLHTARTKTVSVHAFYMDASEISNNEYRQFVDWVRDSIAREKLYRRQSGEDAEQWVNVPDDFFKEPYRTLMSMGSDLQGANTPFDPFLNPESSQDLDKAYLMLTGHDGIKKTKLFVDNTNNSKTTIYSWFLNNVKIKSSIENEIIIDKKITRNSNVFEWNPFSIPDKDLIGLNTNFRNSLFFNKGKQKNSIIYTYSSSSLKNVLNFGSQENYLKNHQLQYVHLVQKFWLILQNMHLHFMVPLEMLWTLLL